LQTDAGLRPLLEQVKASRDQLENRPPLLVKVSPDLDREQCARLAQVVLAVGVDGLVISNTTTQRPSSLNADPHLTQAGGLSGPSLLPLSTDVLRQLYQDTNGKIPIIGVGGITSGKDAYTKIKAGASAVQMYTRFAFRGPVAVRTVKAELAALLRRDGYKSITEAVGADFRR